MMQQKLIQEPCLTLTSCVQDFLAKVSALLEKEKDLRTQEGLYFFDVARILSDKRPRYFLLENVKGLLNHDGGQTFITIIKTLSDLGYNVEWSLLNSKYFRVPQNRERVFIVGYLGKRCAGKIFPIRQTTKSNNSTDTTEVIYWKNSKDKWVKENRINVGTLKTQSDLCRQPLIKVGTYRTQKVDGGFRESVDNQCPTIQARAREDGSGQPCIMYQLPRGYNKGGFKQECPNISSHQFEYNNLLIENRIRRLTPTECFRLQGFPDEIVQKAKELKISDAQLYKMAGNSVTVNVIYEIAKRLKNDSNNNS